MRPPLDALPAGSHQQLHPLNPRESAGGMSRRRSAMHRIDPNASRRASFMNMRRRSSVGLGMLGTQSRDNSIGNGLGLGNPTPPGGGGGGGGSQLSQSLLAAHLAASRADGGASPKVSAHKRWDTIRQNVTGSASGAVGGGAMAGGGVPGGRRSSASFGSYGSYGSHVGYVEKSDHDHAFTTPPACHHRTAPHQPHAPIIQPFDHPLTARPERSTPVYWMIDIQELLGEPPVVAVECEAPSAEGGGSAHSSPMTTPRLPPALLLAQCPYAAPTPPIQRTAPRRPTRSWIARIGVGHGRLAAVGWGLATAAAGLCRWVTM